MPRGDNLKNLPDRLRCTAITKKGTRCLTHRMRKPDGGGYFDKCASHLGVPQRAARLAQAEKQSVVFEPGMTDEEKKAVLHHEALVRQQERQREREDRARAAVILEEIEQAEKIAASKLSPEQLDARRVTLRDREQATVALQHLDPSTYTLVRWIEARQKENDDSYSSWRASERSYKWLIYPYPELLGLDPLDVAQKAVAYFGGLEPTFARMQDANEHHIEHGLDGEIPFPRAGFAPDSEYETYSRRSIFHHGIHVRKKPRPFAPIGSDAWRAELAESRETWGHRRS